MTTNIKSFTVKDTVTVRDDILRTIRNGLLARGVTNPQLGPGSHEFVLATAVANEISVSSANTQVKADAQMPDTADGADLERLAAQYGLARRNSGPSVGYVTLTTSANTYIALGQQLVDNAGQRFKVMVGGTYTNTSPTNLVPVESIDTGYRTNHEADDVLRWTSSPAYAAPTTVVTSAGLTGGVDSEDDASFRTRFLSRLQNPKNSGNWSQIAVFGEESHTSVEKAFVHPAVNGPSTVHITLVAAPAVLTPSITALNANSKNRDITVAILDGTSRPYIQGNVPEYVETLVFTVANVANDVSIGLSLPASVAAVPAGPGGGWLDGTPWPNPGLDSMTKCSVSLVAGFSVPNTIRVDSLTAPVANVSHVCRMDQVSWVLQRALVIAVAGTSGAYDITLDTPFTNVAIGDYIWPDCVNAQTYVDAILGAFALMGPGERSPNAANLTRGYRHPAPATSWPYTLGATQLRAITNSGDEVEDVSWLYRTSSAAPTPVVYADINTQATNIFVPRRIAFYPIV